MWERICTSVKVFGTSYTQNFQKNKNFLFIFFHKVSDLVNATKYLGTI